MLYPLSYEGGPAGSLPPVQLGALGSAGCVIDAAERDEVTVAALGRAPGIALADPGNPSAGARYRHGDISAHRRRRLSPSDARCHHCCRLPDIPTIPSVGPR